MKRYSGRISGRRFAAALLALVLTLSLLTGCGGKDGKDSGGEDASGTGGNGGTETVSDYNAVWKSLPVEGLDLLESSSAGISGICVHDGSYYVFVTNYEDMGKAAAYKVGSDGRVQEEIPLGLTGDSYPSFFCMDGQGNIYYALSVWGEDDMPENLLVKADASGKEVWRVPIGADAEDYFSIYGGAVDEGRGLLISTDAGVEVYNTEDGTRSGVISSGMEYGGTICGLSDGTILLCSIGSMGNYDIKKLDEAGVFQNVELPEEMEQLISSETIMAGPEGTLLMEGSGALFCIDLEKGSIKKYMDYLQSDLDTTQLPELGVLSAEQMLGSVFNDLGEAEVLLFEKADPKAQAEKTVIVLGCPYMEDTVRRQVIAFNRTSDKYRIEVRDYSQAVGDNDNYIETMNNDIITGNIPDILLAGYGLPMDSYIAKGIFEPLDSWLEGDGELKTGDYLSNVLDVGRIGGKLYLLTPSFYVNALAGKKSVIGDVSGITAEEARKYIKQQNIPRETAFGPYMTQQDFLLAAMNATIDDYVDKDTGKCSFSSQGFIDLLELSAELPKEYDYMDEDVMDSMETLMRDGKALLTSAWLYNFRAFSEMEQATVGEPVSYVGYPSENKLGPCIEAELQLAMSASSQNKEAVWDFLRGFLEEDYQEKIEFGFPVRRQALDLLAEKAQERPYYTTETGEKEYYDDSYWINGQEIVVKPFTQEETDQIVAFLGSVKNRADADTNIINIVIEETGAFYSGQKSARDVADTIQSRVQIYLNESR